MISTRFTQMFSLDYPLMSAPMAMHSGGHLAAAVSKAGALGSFGGVHQTKGPDWLRDEIAHIRSQTDRPFGVGFITAFIPMFPTLFDAAVEAKPNVIGFSFGSPGPYADKAKAAGAKVMCQVQSMSHAREAVAAGADILVAQGNEAGGHTGRRAPTTRRWQVSASTDALPISEHMESPLSGPPGREAWRQRATSGKNIRGRCAAPLRPRRLP